MWKALQFLTEDAALSEWFLSKAMEDWKRIIEIAFQFLPKFIRVLSNADVDGYFSS